MKTIKLIIYVLSLLLVIVCSIPMKENKSQISINEQNSKNDVPSDFGFILKYGIGAKNIIDTFEDTFVKDLVTAGTVETKLSFSNEEIEQIYNRMQSISILDYPTNYAPPYSDNPEPGVVRIVTPHITYNLHLTMNSESKDINWEDTNGSDISKAKDLRSLFSYIDGIIKNKEEYNELPEAVGGYM